MYRLLCFLVVLFSSVHAQDFVLTVTGSDFSNSYIYASGAQSILIDTQLTKTDTAKITFALTGQVVNSVRSLTYILLTSDNPRSYLGLATIAQQFPNATIVATPGVAASINARAAATIQMLLAQNVTDINTSVPNVKALGTTALVVGSAVFNLQEITQVASNYSTIVYLPATGTLFPGFLYLGLHPDLTYNIGANSLNKYQVAIRNLLITYSPILVLYPRFGPKLTDTPTIVSMLTQMISYVDDFMMAVESPNSRSDAYATMVYKYPLLQGLNFLTASIAAAIPLCVPNCGMMTCGNDGCGGSCGTCTIPNLCNSYGQCECQANCTGMFCGSDGCGQTCGTCAFGTCMSGLCSCTPSCTGTSCGSDGCGGVCACASGTVCTLAFTCVVPSGSTVGINLNFGGLATNDQQCPA